MTSDVSPHASGGTLLRRGPWSLELRSDELADVAYCGSTVLRGIRAVVRNQNWLTLTPRVRSLQIRDLEEALALEFEVDWNGFGAAYTGRIETRIDEEGLAVAFHGTATEPFLGNRIGLVVLHRPEDAGIPVVVGHPDGSWTEAAFPADISPHQPFKDIAAMSWEREGIRFELGFAGDVFETEDQRNWTDASFKTYSTPLSLPFPIRHEEGSRVEQSIRLRAVHPVEILAEPVARVPEIGFWLRNANSAAVQEIAGPLVLDISPAPRSGDGTLSPAAAVKAAEQAPQGIDARIVASTAAEAIGVLDELPLEEITRLSVFDPTTHVTDASVLGALAAHAHRLGYEGQLLAGARSHFTELNRNAHLLPDTSDGMVYSITSQMHAVEPHSVMETIGIQPLTARQALSIGSGRPIHIGPITIAPRFNAVATEAPAAEELPRPSDLEGQPFGAAWALGSVAALTLPGVSSLSYGIPDAPHTPISRLLTEIARLSGSEVLASASAQKSVLVYPVRTDSGIACFLANPHPWTVDARVLAPDGSAHDIRIPGWDISTLTFA